VLSAPELDYLRQIGLQTVISEVVTPQCFGDKAGLRSSYGQIAASGRIRGDLSSMSLPLLQELSPTSMPLSHPLQQAWQNRACLGSVRR